MSTYTYPRPGLANVGSYQVSGIPFLTSSVIVPVVSGTPLSVDFPGVTKFITVTNNSAGSDGLRFGFSEAGVKGTINNNYVVLAPGDSYTGDLKATSLFLLSDTSNQVTASVVAGITTISINEIPNNWSGSAGVG